jgi:hypothetical protein
MALLLGGHISAVATETGRSDRLDDLLEWIGRPGLVTVALITAYLIGSIITAVTRGLIHQSNERVIGSYPPLDREGDRQERLSIMRPFSLLSVRSFAIELSNVEHEPTRLARLSELLLECYRDGERRLRLASVDLYGDYDRFQSEAELRDSLIVPLPLAIVAVLLNSSLALLTEVVIGVLVVLVLSVLFVQARQLDRRGRSLVLGALTDHTISIPSLDRQGWKSAS